jgi:ABC-type glycerol-3-phosphate transport system substrate-binding protein
MKNKILSVVLTVCMIFGVSGCAGAVGSDTLPQGAYSNEIITTIPVDQDKTMITVRVEFGTGLDTILENLIEEKFPNVDIVIRRDDTAYPAYSMRENLKEGVESDFIISRQLPAVADIAEDYLLDLSSESFVDNYFVTAVENCASDYGEVYYLPGPSDVYGIVYDKTLFDENGWEVPHSYSEFVDLITTINNSGVKADDGVTNITAFLPSMMYPDVFQIFFNTYGYEEAYAGSDNYLWLSSYWNGEGSMVGHMEGAVQKFEQLFADGILSTDVLETKPRIRSQMLYAEHSLAMTVECQNAVTYVETMGKEAGLSDEEIHEVAMMPFWTSDEPESDYLYSIPAYYMAINKSAAEESEEKKQILLGIFDYLSSVEAQKALLNDGFQISNVSGVSIVDNDFSANIIDTIRSGRIINTFSFVNGDTEKLVENQMFNTVSDLLNGTMSVEEWLTEADRVKDEFISGTLNTEEVYGQCEETLTRLESAYTMADIYRELMEADIGIVAAGRYRTSTNGYFYKGDITHSSLLCVTPQKETISDTGDEMANKICVATLTGQQILDILNSNFSLSESDSASCYYVASGLQVTFNPWADAGSRVLSCTLADGIKLDTEASYKVAFYYGSLPDESIVPESALPMTWEEGIVKWLDDNGGTIQKPDMTLLLKYTDETN